MRPQGRRPPQLPPPAFAAAPACPGLTHGSQTGHLPRAAELGRRSGRGGHGGCVIRGQGLSGGTARLTQCRNEHRNPGWSCVQNLGSPDSPAPTQGRTWALMGTGCREPPLHYQAPRFRLSPGSTGSRGGDKARQRVGCAGTSVGPFFFTLLTASAASQSLPLRQLSECLLCVTINNAEALLVSYWKKRVSHLGAGPRGRVFAAPGGGAWALLSHPFTPDPAWVASL